MLGIGLCFLWVSSLLADDPVKVDRQRFSGPSKGVVDNAKRYCGEKGYPTDSVEQIVNATKSDRGAVRDQALLVLVDRIGEKAKPVLRECLDFPRVTTRLKAAELLAFLGDASGVSRMQWDFEELHRPPPKDPNAEPNSIWRREGKWLSRGGNWEALEIGRFLAKCGDNRGFEHAAKTAIEGKPIQRMDALPVLFEISRWSDKSVLATEGRDPEPIFVMMAETETDPHVLYELTNGVTSYLRGETRKLLLDKILASAHVTGKVRKSAETHRRSITLAEERNKKSKETKEDPNSR